MALYYKSLNAHMRKYRSEDKMRELLEQLHNENLKEELEKDNAAYNRTAAEVRKEQLKAQIYDEMHPEAKKKIIQRELNKENLKKGLKKEIRDAQVREAEKTKETLHKFKLGRMVNLLSKKNKISALNTLSKHAHEAREAATNIQKIARGHLARKHAHEIKIEKGATNIQKIARGYLARKKTLSSKASTLSPTEASLYHKGEQLGDLSDTPEGIRADLRSAISKAFPDKKNHQQYTKHFNKIEEAYNSKDKLGALHSLQNKWLSENVIEDTGNGLFKKKKHMKKSKVNTLF